MTVAEVLEQTRTLNRQERKELVKLLIDRLDVNESTSPSKTGAEVVAAIKAMDPILLVDDHIENPVEWVKAQRRK